MEYVLMRDHVLEKIHFIDSSKKRTTEEHREVRGVGRAFTE